IAHQLLAGVERKAVHRSRHVDDEDVFARWYLVSRDALGWFRHQQEEVFLAALEEKQTRADRLVGQPVAPDEVSIAGEVRRIVVRYLGSSLTARASDELMRR